MFLFLHFLLGLPILPQSKGFWDWGISLSLASSISSTPPSLRRIIEFGPLPLPVFSLSSFFLALYSQAPVPPFPYRNIWFPLAPSKVQAFLWKVAWNRAPTLDVIQKFHPHLSFAPMLCPFAFRWPKLTIICFFTVLLFGIYEKSSFVWLTSAGWFWIKELTIFLHGLLYLSKETMDPMSSYSYLGCLEGT